MQLTAYTAARQNFENKFSRLALLMISIKKMSRDTIY